MSGPDGRHDGPDEPRDRTDPRDADLPEGRTADRDPTEPPHPWHVDDPGPGEPPLRERLRARTDLTPRQWMIAVSLLLFLPYPLFVYAVAFTAVDVTLVGVVSIAYSLVAMALHFVL